jgi:hypothetical protein
MFEHLSRTKDADVPLHSKWFTHLGNEESRNDFRRTLFSSKIVLKRLKNILEEEKKSLENSETSGKDFEDGNWAYKQAFRNGERRGLRIVEDLLQFIE